MTSIALVTAIKENSTESRKEFLLDFFLKERSKNSNLTQYQFWKQDHKPIDLWSSRVISQKINDIHQNPVKADPVFRAEDYIFQIT